MRKELSGAILVGGRSRRMGTDKALMLLEGETLLQRTIAVLSLVCCEILVVGNRSDLQVSGARLVADDWQDAGIMGGIATALRVSSKNRVLCVGCDMPFLSEAVLRAMSLEPAGFDVLVPVTSGSAKGPSTQVHPLHAIYASTAVPMLESCISAGKLTMTDAIRHLNARYLFEDWIRRHDPTLDTLVNVNTPGEFADAIGRLHARQHKSGDSRCRCATTTSSCEPTEGLT